MLQIPIVGSIEVKMRQRCMLRMLRMQYERERNEMFRLRLCLPRVLWVVPGRSLYLTVTLVNLSNLLERRVGCVFVMKFRLDSVAWVKLGGLGSFTTSNRI